MEITCEISLYPLTNDYETVIIPCIQYLKKQLELQVYTHAMSTFIKGDSSVVFASLSDLYKQSFMESSTHSLVIKIINKKLPVEDGFLSF